METRKKRATELIEKCDMKIFSAAERTQIVQIYDRRVKVELSESLLEKTSLYAVVRSWIQDDPDKPQMDVVRSRKLRRVETKVDGSIPVMKKLEDKHRESILKSDSQVSLHLWLIALKVASDSDQRISSSNEAIDSNDLTTVL